MKGFTPRGQSLQHPPFTMLKHMAHINAGIVLYYAIAKQNIMHILQLVFPDTYDIKLEVYRAERKQLPLVLQSLASKNSGHYQCSFNQFNIVHGSFLKDHSLHVLHMNQKCIRLSANSCPLHSISSFRCFGPLAHFGYCYDQYNKIHGSFSLLIDNSFNQKCIAEYNCCPFYYDNKLISCYMSFSQEVCFCQ